MPTNTQVQAALPTNVKLISGDAVTKRMNYTGVYELPGYPGIIYQKYTINKPYQQFAVVHNLISGCEGTLKF